jgi:hypothetical protein
MATKEVLALQARVAELEAVVAAMPEALAAMLKAALAETLRAELVPIVARSESAHERLDTAAAAFKALRGEVRAAPATAARIVQARVPHDEYVAALEELRAESESGETWFATKEVLARAHERRERTPT